MIIRGCIIFRRTTPSNKNRKIEYSTKEPTSQGFFLFFILCFPPCTNLHPHRDHLSTYASPTPRVIPHRAPILEVGHKRAAPAVPAPLIPNVSHERAMAVPIFPDLAMEKIRGGKIDADFGEFGPTRPKLTRFW
jgi:hypothetical protein